MNNCKHGTDLNESDCMNCENEKKEVSELKAAAVMGFINMTIGAFESGFIESHKPTLSELYRAAQHHVKDAYGVDHPMINEAWGEEVAKLCKDGNGT